MAQSADPNRLLAIYLNDHFAAATLGVELARRLRTRELSARELLAASLRRIDEVFPKGAAAGHRYPEAARAALNR